jgi:hypothetical protein
LFPKRWREVLDPYCKERGLNMGCGNTILPGWTNVDLFGSPDLKFDLRKPWPIKNGSYRTVHASHILEHFRDEELFHILNEAARVLMSGGYLIGVVPYGFTTTQLSCPFHKQLFTVETLVQLSSKNYDNDAYCSGMGQGIQLAPWILDGVWLSKADAFKNLSPEKLKVKARTHLNVYHEMVFAMRLEC